MMHFRLPLYLLAFCVAFNIPTSVAAQTDDDIRINQIQVIGSHNSFRRAIPEAVQNLLRQQFPGDIIPGTTTEQLLFGLEYEHPPFEEQFTRQNLRQLEIDIYHDPDGGRYTTTAAEIALEAVGEDVGMFQQANPRVPGLSRERIVEELNRPSTKVMHTQGIDYWTQCLSLTSCMGQVRQWSDANPNHLPILIFLNLKEDSFPGVTPALAFDEAAFQTVEQEVRQALGSKLLTPNELIRRAGTANLRDAILEQGWPTLRESRGRIMIVTNRRDVYVDNRPGLQGASLFVWQNDATAPDAGIAGIDDPRGDNQARIQALVDQGFIVAARADADTIQARTGDTSQRDTALASGAQFIRTDFADPSTAAGFDQSYFVSLGNGLVARCNPVNGGLVCTRSSTLFLLQDDIKRFVPHDLLIINRVAIQNFHHLLVARMMGGTTNPKQKTNNAQTVKSRFWGRAGGQYGNFSAFETASQGYTLAYEQNLRGGMFGLGYNFSRHDFEHDQSVFEGDANNHQIFAYGRYDIAAINGALLVDLIYAYNDNNYTRNTSSRTSSDQADGDYESHAFNLATSYIHQWISVDGNVRIKPFAGLRWWLLGANEFFEEGPRSNLKISWNAQNRLFLEAGSNFAVRWTPGQTETLLSFYSGFNYAVLNDNPEYRGEIGQTVFREKRNYARFSVNLGLGLDIHPLDRLVIKTFVRTSLAPNGENTVSGDVRASWSF